MNPRNVVSRDTSFLKRLKTARSESETGGDNIEISEMADDNDQAEDSIGEEEIERDGDSVHEQQSEDDGIEVSMNKQEVVEQEAEIHELWTEEESMEEEFGIDEEGSGSNGWTSATAKSSKVARTI